MMTSIRQKEQGGKWKEFVLVSLPHQQTNIMETLLFTRFLSSSASLCHSRSWPTFLKNTSALKIAPELQWWHVRKRRCSPTAGSTGRSRWELNIKPRERQEEEENKRGRQMSNMRDPSGSTFITAPTVSSLGAGELRGSSQVADPKVVCRSRSVSCLFNFGWEEKCRSLVCRTKSLLVQSS